MCCVARMPWRMDADLTSGCAMTVIILQRRLAACILYDAENASALEYKLLANNLLVPLHQLRAALLHSSLCRAANASIGHLSGEGFSFQNRPPAVITCSQRLQLLFQPGRTLFVCENITERQQNVQPTSLQLSTRSADRTHSGTGGSLEPPANASHGTSAGENTNPTHIRSHLEPAHKIFDADYRNCKALSRTH